MHKHTKKHLVCGGLFFLLFLLFTVSVSIWDVQPIGPMQSTVGFASVNHFVHNLVGTHLLWYNITDWLGAVAILFALSFATVGFCQLVKRKSIRKVDRTLLLLGLFYLSLLVLYLFFEQAIINRRPILLDGALEASYPSSHTVMVLFIMGTAGMQVRALRPDRKALYICTNAVATVLIVLTVLGRLLSGVHWFTDIVGGVLLSVSLAAFYRGFAEQC